MTPPAAAARIVLDSLNELATRTHPDNAKGHDIVAIEASFEAFGFIDPPVVNDRDGHLLGGHGRVEALLRMRAQSKPPPGGITVDNAGDWMVPTLHGYDLTPDQAKRYLIAANRTVELGGWDLEKLTSVLSELTTTEDGLTGVGYSLADLERLVHDLQPLRPAQRQEPDDLPAAEPPFVRPGQLWTLGDHRLLCGDATDGAVVARLIGDRFAAALVTDPPYGVAYQGKTRRRLTIANDDSEGLERLLRASFSAIDRALHENAAIYLFHPAGPLSLVFLQEFVDAGWTLRQTLVWAKSSMVLGRSDFHYRHEPIAYGHKPGSGRFGRGHLGWFGGDSQQSILEFPKPAASTAHPTMKPVGLVAALLRNSTRPGDHVLDPFVGSGTTIIAAEQLGRRCLAIELDPQYASLAIRRWEAFAGRHASLTEA